MASRKASPIDKARLRVSSPVSARAGFVQFWSMRPS